MSESQCTAEKTEYRCEFPAGHDRIAIPEFRDGTEAFDHGCHIEVRHMIQFLAWDEDGVRDILVGPPVDDVTLQAFGGLFAPPATGATSDGYHTFDELYAHRTMLFAMVTVLTSLTPWRSKAHEDGTMFEGMFVVGLSVPVSTRPSGFEQVTYHCDLGFWDCFDHCVTLPHAPHWDGRTSEDVLDTLGRWVGMHQAIIDMVKADRPSRPADEV